MHAALEIAIAAEHRADGQIALLDGRRNLIRQRPRVADARRAAVAHQIETEQVEVLGQPGLLEVLRDDLRARRERRLDPRLDLQALGDRLLGDQAGADHHGRVRRVRAARDGRDDDRAVVEVELRALEAGLDAGLGGGGDLRALGGLHLAEVRAGRGLLRLRGHAGELAERVAERGAGLLDEHAVLRALRAGDGRLDGAEVELESVGVLGVGRLVGAVQALLLGVGLNEGDLVVGTAGEAEVLDRLVVDRENADGGAELGAHVAERRAVGERQAGQAGTVELDELADDALLAQHLGDGEHEIGRRRALGQAAGELEADHLRDEHRHGLAEHGRLGLDAAHAPTDDAQAVDHRRVRVGADEGVRVGVDDAVLLHREDDARQVLDVDLVDDAGLRRDDLEVVERFLAPLEELVALAVALVLDGGVEAQRVGRGEAVDLHGVIDDKLGGLQRIDALWVAAHGLHRLAHGGEVDDGGHAGEVLHQHARRTEGDLLARRGLRIPVDEGLDIGLGDGRAVLVAQQVFEQDAQRVGQARGLVGPDRVEAIDAVGLALDGEFALGAEAVHKLLSFAQLGGSTGGAGNEPPRFPGRFETEAGMVVSSRSSG